MDVHIQDQFTRAFDIPFHLTLGTTSLASDVVEDSYSFTAINGHGIQVGETVALYDIEAEYGYSTQALNIVGDLIEVDSPAIGNFSALSTMIARSTEEMNVDGSSERKTFEVVNPFVTAEDITQIHMMIVCSTAPTIDAFGDLSSLARGVVFRKLDHERIVYFNAKNNSDLALLMHDIHFFTSTPGIDGVSAKYTFNGQGAHGVSVRLKQYEKLEMIVQDDLTNLISFRAQACGNLAD